MNNADRLPRCTPEEAGFSSEQLEACLHALCHPETTMHGFMAARHGKVFAEAWWAPFAPDLPHSNHSFGKSYTAAAVGIAAGEGLLSLDERMTDIFADEIAQRGIRIEDERMQRITVRHVLSMSGGMKTMSTFRGDWIGAYFRSEMAHEPGTHFYYNSAGSCMLGALVEKRTGRGLREYLTEKLFVPCGMDAKRFVWLRFPDGTYAEPGTFTTTENNLRLAMLYAQGGRWQGRQVIPETFVRESLSIQTDTKDAPEQRDGRCGYGYQLWACSIPGVFRFDGGQGQYGIIWPEKDLAISIHEGAWAHTGPQHTLDALYESLLRHISDTPLPENPAAHRHLLETEKALKCPDAEPNQLPMNPAFAGDWLVESGNAEPWLSVSPPGSWDFFTEFRDPAVPSALSRLGLTLHADACEVTINGNTRICARWDGKLRRGDAQNTVFPQLGAYSATARFTSEDLLEITIRWINGWFVTRLFLQLEAPDRLRIESDKLRLTLGAEGLKGTSMARRVDTREAERN